MRAMTFFLLSAVLVILLSGAARAPDPVPPDPVPPNPGLETPFEDGCTGCRTCYGVSYWHNTNYAPPMADYGGPQHLCQMGNCGEHGICGGEEEAADQVALVAELEAVRKALLSEELQELRRVLSKASSRVALNGTRMAVQVTGCSGDIVAHFPLTEAQLAGLPG